MFKLVALSARSYPDKYINLKQASGVSHRKTGDHLKRQNSFILNNLEGKIIFNCSHYYSLIVKKSYIFSPPPTHRKENDNQDILKHLYPFSLFWNEGKRTRLLMIGMYKIHRSL